MIKYTLLFTLIVAGIVAKSQDCDSVKTKEESKKWRGLLLDVGFNQTISSGNAPFPHLSFWRSKGVNVYHFWAIQLSKKFHLAPGIGIGSDNYSFDNKNLRLTSTPSDSLLIWEDNTPAIKSRKSKLSATYIDIPLELRFQTGRFKSREFRFAIGVKAGYLLSAHTKIKYELTDGGSERKDKFHQNFGLQKFRYGINARIGYSHFNFFGYYSLSNLFRKDKGPEVTPYMVGISVTDLFSLQDLARKKKK